MKCWISKCLTKWWFKCGFLSFDAILIYLSPSDSLPDNPNPNIKMENEKIVRVTEQKYDWSVELYLFGQLIVESHDNKNQIAEIVKNAYVQNKSIRFNLWRLFLNIMDTDATWPHKLYQLATARTKYNNLLSKYTYHRASTSYPAVKKNPLGALLKAPAANTASTAKDDISIQRDIKNQLMSVDIYIGVMSKDKARTLMSRILFIWDKLYGNLDAKNNKIELLSNIVYIYGQSAVASIESLKDSTASNELKEMYMQANSLEHAYADIFSVFSAVMEKHKEMFRLEADLGKVGINPNSRNHNALLQRISHVWYIYLKAVDIDLFRHLQMLEFNPRPVLSKWIKPLLCREFEFAELMSVWDNIFLESLVHNKPTFYHLDYTCLAMVIYLRDIIMNKESAYEVTQILVKFPTVTGIYLQELINLSWMIRDLYMEELGRKEEVEENRNSRKASEEVSKIEAVSEGDKKVETQKIEIAQKIEKVEIDDKSVKEVEKVIPKVEEQKTEQVKEPRKQSDSVANPLDVLQRIRKTIEHKNIYSHKTDKAKQEIVVKHEEKPKSIVLDDSPQALQAPPQTPPTPPPQPSQPPPLTLKPDYLKYIQSLLSYSLKLAEDIDLKAKLLKIQKILQKSLN